MVDPLDVGSEGSQSPEGQAFVLILHAAWRDWNAAGNGARTNSAGFPSIPFPALVRIWSYIYCWAGGGYGAGLVLAVFTTALACTLSDLFV